MSLFRRQLLALAMATVASVHASCRAQATLPAELPAAADAPSAAEMRAGSTAAPASAADDLSTNELLDRMHTLGVELKSLRADIEMQSADAISGNDSTRTGTFLLERRDGDSRARVNFNRLIIDDGVQKKIIPERIEYLLAGDWVVDRVYGRGENDPGGKRETHRQIRKPGEKVDLLKLGEGPFPLPIGQPRDSVRAQFEVTRLPDDPEKPGLLGLELRPREETRLARRFHQITMWIDPADAMPRIIETVSADLISEPDPANPGKDIVQLVAGTESKRTTLSAVKINEPVTEADFTLEPVDDTVWSIVRDAYRE